LRIREKYPRIEIFVNDQVFLRRLVGCFDDFGFRGKNLLIINCTTSKRSFIRNIPQETSF